MPTPPDSAVELEDHPLRNSPLHKLLEDMLLSNERRPQGAVWVLDAEAERLSEAHHNEANERIEHHWKMFDDENACKKCCISLFSMQTGSINSSKHVGINKSVRFAQQN